MVYMITMGCGDIYRLNDMLADKQSGAEAGEAGIER